MVNLDIMLMLYRTGLIILFGINFVIIKSEEDNLGSGFEEKSLVQVRAVFINCQIEDGQNASDSESSRFQREELFKHDVLRDCNKKLALTLKISSESDKNSDEYIPIDHVSQGPSKKRVRLLNPYVLRLRWDTPLQAYRLRRRETISGIVTNSNESPFETMDKYKGNRVRRDFESFTVSDRWSPNSSSVGTPFTIIKDDEDSPENMVPQTDLQISSLTLIEISTPGTEDCTKREVCTVFGNLSSFRQKRQEHNIIIERNTDNDVPWGTNFQPYSEDKGNVRRKPFEDPSQTLLKYTSREDVSPSSESLESLNKNIHLSDALEPIKVRSVDDGNSYEKIITPIKSHKPDIIQAPVYQSFDSTRPTPIYSNFAMYEIGHPDLWSAAHVQLFKKLNTREGKTVWQDFTKGEIMSISSLSPQWTNQDVDIRFRPTDRKIKDEFTLPIISKLSLLLPLKGETMPLGIGEYIIVPTEDLDMTYEDELNKRDGNESTFSSASKNNEEPYRKVLVRISRAILGSTIEKLRIVSQGGERYLTLPHRMPYQVQIDLEARADDNQLVIVGCDDRTSGRITTAVSDNMRRSRAVLTVQATNTGLAAARYRLKVRDCGTDLLELINENNNDGIIAGPVLLPPRQTRRLRLELPVEISSDIIHCSVELINDNDDPVAVRDVTIKKGDRCFCVWHCDCVCLGEDPKLLCREMAEMRQLAAGLSLRKKRRPERSICFPDLQSVDIVITISGVLALLLALGFLKACCGLFCKCIGSWGLSRILQMPRKLCKYYEPSIADCPVEYDDEGWPVHPRTKQRTVRMLSPLIEFTLNLVFFIVVPCVIVWDAIKQIVSRSKNKLHSRKTNDKEQDMKKCYSTVDLQGLESRLRQRRRTYLQRWMSPEAENLSGDIWRDGLPHEPVLCEFMQPLLREEYRAKMGESYSSCLDSEQDDADYVLMQMQKSRESLARTQKEIDNMNSPSSRRQPSKVIKQ